MRELSKQEQDLAEVIHLRDRFPGNTEDVEWASKLAEDGPWCVLSSDAFRKNRDAEREALRRGGHTVFVLESQWTRNHKYWAQAAQLVAWWPRILAQSREVSGGVFAVPWRATSKFRSMPASRRARH